MKDEAGQIRENEHLNWGELEAYLKERIPSISGKMHVAQFHGGHANLSYLISFDNDQYVLRRPPFGKIAPGAHDMNREYRVLSKLWQFYPQAPRAYLYCDDVNVIGAPFVLMQRREGIVPRYAVPDELKTYDDVERRMTHALVKAHAELHMVDFVKAKLEDLGKPENFLKRQISAWIKRWTLLGHTAPGQLLSVFENLEKICPVTQYYAIIHNDFKFDNCQFQADSPDEISSVFDWDMATIGDPLFDFASSLVYWPDPEMNAPDIPVLLKGNFPQKSYLKKTYFELTGFDGSNFKWYECLAYAKTAVIAAQLFYRFKKGETTDKRMAGFGKISESFIKKAESLL